MYLALYRKYRPSSFDDVISQEHITTTLKNQIATGQIAHAYLFTGTRGTGKTTCAKIMARAVNCVSPVKGSPCGECASCKAIANGSTDIIEIDAASNNGVDSIRQIRDEVIYAPIDCKYKVYIIDEVHMLSPSAFNALLKTLEEPPSHAIFILATTEYYKVPATILSRCQQFLFYKIDPKQSAKRLLEVAEKEQVTLTPAAASLIARLSDGAMRDALSLLDQCLSADSKVDEELVRRCSGAADSGWLFGITEAAISQKPADALKILDLLIGQGKDLNRFIEELTLHLRNLMLTKAVPNSGLVSAGEEELKKYGRQCRSCSADEIMRWVELVSESLDKINRMKQTGQARLLTESLLIRLCSPKSDTDVSAFAARLGALEQRIENLKFSDIRTEDTIEQEPPIAQPERSEPKFEAAEQMAETAPEPIQELSEPDSLSEPDPLSAPNQAYAMPDPPPAEDFPFDPPYTNIPPEPSIEDILSYPDVEAEADADELPPPPELIEGQTFFVEPSPVIAQEQGEPDKPQQEPDEPPQPDSGQEPEQLQPDSEPEPPQPISETDEELPNEAQPLPQWSDIVSELPVATRHLLSGTQAFLCNGRIFIQASPSARKILENGKRAELLRDSAKAVLGGRFELLLLKEQEEEQEHKEDKITPFLSKAKEMGIDVTINDR